MTRYMVESRTYLRYGNDYFEPPEYGADVVEIETDCTKPRDIFALAAKMDGMSHSANDNRGDEKPPWYGWTLWPIPPDDALIDDMITEWHNAPEDGVSLIQYLGMSWKQYAKYVETGKIPKGWSEQWR